jgi:hypothetical protein
MLQANLGIFDIKIFKTIKISSENVGLKDLEIIHDTHQFGTN